MDGNQTQRQGYPQSGWWIAIFFGFPFAPILMLIGVLVPAARRYLGVNSVIVGTIIGYAILFVAGVAVTVIVEHAEPSHASPTRPVQYTPHPRPERAGKSMPTVPPPIQYQWSTGARRLAHHYSILLGFKDDVDFHTYCYAQSHRFSEWANRVQHDPAPIQVMAETGIMPADLWQMGLDYCNNSGRETDYTLLLRSQMNPDWLLIVN